jgi:PKD repeat protein
VWKFGNGDSSTALNPTYSYPSAGSYTITFAGSGPTGNCTKNLNVVILPSPDIKVSLVSADTQCFRNNNFCFLDSSEATNGEIVRQTLRFSNGKRLDSLNPTFPIPFCCPITDPTGGYFDLIVESEDTNGCVAREDFRDILYVKPKIGAQFSNVTPAPNPGCGTTLGTFQNVSLISLNNVDSFTWHFGDGTFQKGTSTNTTLWDSVSHNYTTHGSFDVSLQVYAHGCSDLFTFKNAVANLIINPQIESYGDTHFEFENPIQFQVKNLPASPGVSYFLWNFGDPASESVNTNDRTLIPEHSYSLGPKMISLRILVGPCDITLYDTITIVGPLAAIEIPFNRIPQDEKTQCGTNDSIHFTNNSTFYLNDSNPNNDDSTILVNGKTEFVFNHTPPTGGGGVGTGDQTAISPANLNRVMGSQVVRVWDFGDAYAPQCTTSSAKSLNVGVNCNFSEDEFPVHKYQSWDSIYHNRFFSTNDTFGCTKYNDTTNSCYIQDIDTSNGVKHREIFDRTVPIEYTATLWLKDTISGVESSDTVTIDLRRPDASKMTLASGVPCPYYNGNSNYLMEFDMNAGGKSYFAVNFDSLAYGASGFTPYNQGVLAAPRPGSTLPFQLPYSIAGSLGDEFIKGYRLGEIGNSSLRSPKGSFTMGLIVGKGPPSAGGGPPTCVDTAWYPDFFRIPYLTSEFETVSPSTDKKSICAGDAAYFKINQPFQNDISILRWNWGHQGVGRGPNLDVYVETFTYIEKYNGPSPTRNDKDIVYNGEDWQYNYVVRRNINDISGNTILDTIVTSIIKDWKSEAVYEFDNELVLDALSLEIECTERPKKEMYKLWGDGTFGCIDTTGFSEFLTIEKSEYRSYNGDHVYTVGNKRYRYTNTSNTDSVEVAHILHFRDSSLQGYDTLIVDTDTTPGVWKHQYVYQDIVDGDTIQRSASGPMAPNFFLQSISGCESRHASLLNVGFLNEYSLVKNTLCEGLRLDVNYKQRYYQYGEEETYTYPIKTFPYWQDFERYTTNKETYTLDWDSTDGVWDDYRSINPNQIYTDPGEYTITIVTKDSTNCRDTVYLKASVSAADPNFGYELSIVNCESIVSFTDSSTANADEIISWEWDFGDGRRTSILQNPRHKYTSYGFFDVTLKIRSKNGCIDSNTKMIYIPGPQPEFEFDLDVWYPKDTMVICAEDSILLINTSKGDVSTPTFQMNWGDGTFTNAAPIGENFSHRYTSAGTYELYLSQKDLIPGTSLRCIRIFPDTNPDLVTPRRIVVIVNELPPATISAKTSPTYENHPTEFTANLDPKYTRMKWYADGDSAAKQVPDNKFIYQFKTKGIHTVTLAPEYDIIRRCWARDTFTIEVLDESLNNIPKLAHEVTVYPNPTNDILNVSTTEGMNVQSIALIDMLGKEYEVTVKRLGDIRQIDVSEFAAGTYTLAIKTDRGILYKQVSVLKE